MRRNSHGYDSSSPPRRRTPTNTSLTTSISRFKSDAKNRHDLDNIQAQVGTVQGAKNRSNEDLLQRELLMDRQGIRVSILGISEVNMKKIGWAQQRQTSKLMHDWLPTMHMQVHITGISQCPGCSCPDEILNHVFQCPHELMKKRRQERIAQMRKKGIKEGVPRNIINTFCDVLHNTSSPNSIPLVQPVYSDEVQAAIVQQEGIGNEMMTRGFLATGWMTALVESGCPNPEQRMNTLQTMVWDEFAFPMWAQRNEIFHYLAVQAD